MATSLLPAEKRKAVRALYAFCRVADNIADNPEARRAEDVQAALATWRRRNLSTPLPAGAPVDASPEDLVAIAGADARSRFRVPACYAEQLIEGVGRDASQKRYTSFEELAAYAYGVASTVGLMSMYIIGFRGSEAIPYAIRMGVALQMTNVLRDVGEDWRAGRLYLPAEELAAFGLTEGDVANGRVDSRWRAFMRFQISRNRQLYAEALPGVRLLHPDGRLAVRAAGELYRTILDDVEAHDYDVFHRRAHVSAGGKLARLPGIWWRGR